MWFYLKIFYLFVIGAGAVTAILLWRRLPLAFRIAGIYLAATFVSEAAAMVIAVKYHNTLLLNGIYAVVETGLLAAVLFCFTDDPGSRKLMLGLLAPTLGLIMYNETNIFLLKQDNAYSISLKSFYFIVSALLFIRHWLVTYDSSVRRQSAPYLFSLSVLIFFTVNFLYWIANSLEFYMKEILMGRLIWILYFSNIMLYTMIFYSICLAAGSKQEHGPR